MDKVVWPSNSHEAERQGFHGHWPNMKAYVLSVAWVVEVLLQRRDDQLKIGFP